MEDYSSYFEQAELIVGYLKGELTDQQKAELNDWIAQSDRNKALFEKLTSEDAVQRELELLASFDKEAAWERIVAATDYDKPVYTTYIGYRWIKYAAAALVLVVSGLLGYRFLYKSEPVKQVAQQPADVSPGSDKAILTLADASQIILDDATNGEIARQGGITITKTADGQLVYDASRLAPSGTTENASKLVYNTITTPRGGKFRIVLPDGSRVWLNAASSLTYPTAFLENTRKVELKGEAYFEIAHANDVHRKAMPFLVVTVGQVVEVLGTHFNINSYSDENSVKTTLLEGKVKVTRTHTKSIEHKAEQAALVLKPGQQAQLDLNSRAKLNLVAKVDLEEAVAWKNGQFQFKDTDLPTIMRQISRWYDVEVDFQGKIPETKFRGKISRDVPLSQFFQILQLSGVNFKIEGRKIIVKA
ncbi:FecR domain-containing protein [Spirosoma sp. SC4-14]|uniref:FecR family protein n=1 Tax=Spirosoma sp. SC4-14 TaxID=3128900 RepID=UPI0030D35B43